MNNKTNFVFDLDDTLTDSYEFNQQVFVDVFAPYIDLSNIEVEKYLRDLHFQSRGRSMHAQFEEAIKNFSLNIKPEALLIENERLQTQDAENIKIFEAVEEIIKNLKKRGKKISILSNRQTNSLEKIIQTHKLMSYLTNVISCADAGYEKPNPYCLNKIILDSGQSKDSFIYFGDSKTDYEFAKAAGVDFIIIDHYLNQKNFYKMIIESFM